MNREAVKAEINNIIEAAQASIRYARQHAPSKKYITRLTELGIIDLMPAKFGNTDAQAVIAAAENNGKMVGGFNAYGEGDVVKTDASTLYTLLNEVETIDAEAQTEERAEVQVEVEDYNAILEAVVEYIESLETPDADKEIRILLAEMHTGYDLNDNEVFNREAYNAELKAYRERVALGKLYFERNYRIHTSRRIVDGHADLVLSEIEADDKVLAYRSVWSGHMATSPTHRWQYLVKVADDDLITLSLAAELLHGKNNQSNRVKVQQAITRGELERFIAPNENNPQWRGRVSRQEVMALKAKREAVNE